MSHRTVTIRGNRYTVVRREASSKLGYSWFILRDDQGKGWTALVKSTRRDPAPNARLVRARTADTADMYLNERGQWVDAARHPRPKFRPMTRI